MMMQTSNKTIDVHKLEVTDVKDSFVLKTEVTRVERSNLLSLPNPKYNETIKRFEHLKGVTMDDTDEKERTSDSFNLRSKRLCEDQNAFPTTCRSNGRASGGV